MTGLDVDRSDVPASKAASGMAIVMGLGAILSLVFADDPNPLFRLLVGGTLASFPGFMIGALWHFIAEENFEESMLELFQLLAAAVFISMLGVAFQNGRAATRSGVELLADFTDRRYQSMTVMDACGQETLAVFHDIRAIDRVRDAFADSVPKAYYGRLTITQAWLVVFEGDGPRREYWIYMPPNSTVASNTNTRARGAWASYEFIPRNLRPWLVQHFPPSSNLSCSCRRKELTRDTSQSAARSLPALNLPTD